jgi:hypothetical protein
MSTLPLALLLAIVPAAASASEGQQPADPAPPDTSQAQLDPPFFQVGGGLMMGVPVGTFQDNVDFSAGVSGHVGFGIGTSPFSIGAEGSALWYGSESRDVPLVGLPGLAVGVNTTNAMYLLHGRVRAQKRVGRVRPYVDGLVGFNYLVTATSIDADTDCYDDGSSYDCDDDGDSMTHLDDLVLSAGGGAGVMIAFGSSPRPLSLDLSLRYLYGDEADYLTEGDVLFREQGVVLRRRRSRTDMLMVYVGVAWGR